MKSKRRRRRRQARMGLLVGFAVAWWVVRRLGACWQQTAGQEGAFGGFPKRTYPDLEAFLDDLRFMFSQRQAIHEAVHRLDTAFQHRIMLVVTQVNDCRYCASVHSQAALTDGFSEEEVACLLDGVVDNCPEAEIPALLYAQQWAEAGGRASAPARRHLVQVYGEADATAIETAMRMIKCGNYLGNTFDYLLYRLSCGRWGIEY